MYEKIAHLVLKYLIEKEGIVASSDDLKQMTNGLAKVIKDRFDLPILPDTGESIAVTSSSAKTAALFFDRVWYPKIGIDPPPKGIVIYGATEFEVWLESLVLFIEKGDLSKHEVRKLFDNTPIAGHRGFNIDINRIIAESLFMNYGFTATPVYNSMKSLKNEYQPGNIEVVIAAIKNIMIVNDHNLKWEQVEEFRKDSNARKKYRRMIHWLDTEMVGKSEKFITDRIANKLEDYEWALKKHGIETITGCLSRILDPRFIAASSAAVAGLAYAGDQSMAAIGGLGLLAVKAAISITKAGLDITDRRRGKDSEVAYVYDMKKKLKQEN